MREYYVARQKIFRLIYVSYHSVITETTDGSPMAAFVKHYLQTRMNNCFKSLANENRRCGRKNPHSLLRLCEVELNNTAMTILVIKGFRWCALI